MLFILGSSDCITVLILGLFKQTFVLILQYYIKIIIVSIKNAVPKI